MSPKQTQLTYNDDFFIQAGEALSRVGIRMASAGSASVDVVGLNIKRPQTDGGEFLCVVKGVDVDGTAVVAFHSAFTLEELFRGLRGRLANGTLKWREDQFMK